MIPANGLSSRSGTCLSLKTKKSSFKCSAWNPRKARWRLFSVLRKRNSTVQRYWNNTSKAELVSNKYTASRLRVCCCADTVTLFNILAHLILTAGFYIMLKEVFLCPVCKHACADPHSLWLHRKEVHNNRVYERSFWSFSRGQFAHLNTLSRRFLISSNATVWGSRV